MVILGRMLVVCPHCHKQMFDLTKGTCQSCGLAGAANYAIDAHALAGLLRNIELIMFDLQPDQFQQILGLFGPSSTDDGIPFDDHTADVTQRYLIANHVLCVRIDYTVKHHTTISLGVSETQAGIDRFIKQARKEARKTRARLKITQTPP